MNNTNLELIKSLFADHSHDNFTATYSPEDDKLRLYIDSRIDKDQYQSLRNLGFRYAPKQELSFVKWSPLLEDVCVFLAGEITGEETTLLERAEAKADRLDGYSSKRQAESNAFYNRANEISERFYMGQPILIGHHSERKARRDQASMHNAMEKSIKQAGLADYWANRAVGVLHHANGKYNERTIRNRIKTLLADLRGLQRDVNHAQKMADFWQEINAIDEETKFNKAVEKYAGQWGVNGYLSSVDDAKALENGTLAHKDVVANAISFFSASLKNSNRTRYIIHILNRLGFERGLLGTVARFDGELTPAIVQTFLRTFGAEKPKAQRGGLVWDLASPVNFPLHIGEGDRLAFTEDELRDLMQSMGYEVPQTKRKAPRKSSAVSLLNPTLEQAQALQQKWNADMKAKCEQKSYKAKEAALREYTQSQYSALSGGEYAPCKTIELDKQGNQVSVVWKNHERVKSGEPVCRIRIRSASEFYQADSVIFINDKPAKTLPIELDAQLVNEF